MLNPRFRSQQTRMENMLKKELPKRHRCPHCKRLRGVEKFGTRVQHDASGKPLRALLQSYCVDCRKGAARKH